MKFPVCLNHHHHQRILRANNWHHDGIVFLFLDFFLLVKKNTMINTIQRQTEFFLWFQIISFFFLVTISRILYLNWTIQMWRMIIIYYAVGKKMGKEFYAHYFIIILCDNRSNHSFHIKPQPFKIRFVSFRYVFLHLIYQFIHNQK